MRKTVPMVLALAAAALCLIYVHWFLQASRAEDARTMVSDIADANVLYRMESGLYATGFILDNDHPLINEEFIPSQSWEELNYRYEGADQSQKPCYLARAFSKGKTSPEEWIADLDGNVVPMKAWRAPDYCKKVQRSSPSRKATQPEKSPK